jgi:hypothetical protein
VCFHPSPNISKKRVGDLPDHVHKYDRSLRAIRTDQYKYIRGSDGSQQYSAPHDDPDATTARSDTHPDLADTLEIRLDEWLDSFERADSDDETTMSDDAKARLEDLGYLQD